MVLLLPYVSFILMLVGVVWSRSVMQKAMAQLTPLAHILASKIMMRSLMLNAAISLCFLAVMPISAQWKLNARLLPMAPIIVSVVFGLAYMMLNHSLHQLFVKNGLPETFGQAFVKSRVIFFIGLLIGGYYLFSLAEKFAKSSAYDLLFLFLKRKRKSIRWISYVNFLLLFSFYMPPCN